MISKETIAKIANCLEVPPGKLSTNDEQVVSRTIQGKKVAGFITILNSVFKNSKSGIALNSCRDPEIEAQVNQWIEYALIYVGPESKNKQFSQQLLKDFDLYLVNRSYLVGQFLTLADVVNFYAILHIMKSLSVIEKERYINLSRWFDHLQQHEDLRQEEKLVNFVVLHLHGWATGTHL